MLLCGCRFRSVPTSTTLIVQASGNKEEVLLKRKINTLKKELKAAKKATSGEAAMADLDGDGPADPVKYNTLKKKAALKVSSLLNLAQAFCCALSANHLYVQ